MKTDLSSIIDLQLIPFGNAKKEGNKFVCQHGTQECEGNRYEQCAIAHYPNVTQHFGFIFCMEDTCEGCLDPSDYIKCAKKNGMDRAVLEKCFNGPQSQQLQEQAFQETPSHDHVPWVQLNGEHCSSCEGSLAEFTAGVCAAYKGSAPKPTVCNKVVGQIHVREESVTGSPCNNTR